MKLLLEVCLRPGNSQVDFKDDRHYDQHPNYNPNPIWIARVCMQLFFRGVSRAKDQFGKF